MVLSKRELRILWITIAVGGGTLLWAYGIVPLYDRYKTVSEELTKEEQTFVKNKDKLNRATKIQADYQRIEAQFPKDVPGKRPDHAFSEDVDAAAEAILPGEKRTIEPVQTEEIKDVTGYEFLTLAMGITGELDKIAQLLKGFDQKGFLIKSISLYHTKGVTNPELKLDITLARIVKVEQEEDKGPGRRRPGLRKPATGGRKP
jgi:hypothetical protein